MLFISSINMDSKGSVPTSYDHETAPPSYTETISPSSPNLFPYSTSSASRYYTAQIQDQLRSLTTQIRSAQTERSLLTHGSDEQILALLATEIQIYFSGFANSGLQHGTLILIPSSAVQENATPMEYDFRNPEEYDQVVRVRSNEEKAGGQWFWQDEEMTKRLARYLSPTPSWKELPSRMDDGNEDDESKPAAGKAFVKRIGSPATRAGRSVASETAPLGEHAPRNGFMRRKEKTPTEEMQKHSKGFFGFRKKGTITSIERPPAVEERDLKIDPGNKGSDASPEDEAALTVRAEEVSFRMENEMGLFETQRGWAVVLKLKVSLGRR